MDDEPSSEPTGIGVRVLLFEDHAQLREVLQQVLIDAGYRVSPCPSQREVLAAGRA